MPALRPRVGAARGFRTFFHSAHAIMRPLHAFAVVGASAISGAGAMITL